MDKITKDRFVTDLCCGNHILCGVEIVRGDVPLDSLAKILAEIDEAPEQGVSRCVTFRSRSTVKFSDGSEIDFGRAGTRQYFKHGSAIAYVMRERGGDGFVMLYKCHKRKCNTCYTQKEM